jgi:hypothetical protein
VYCSFWSSHDGDVRTACTSYHTAPIYTDTHLYTLFRRNNSYAGSNGHRERKVMTPFVMLRYIPTNKQLTAAPQAVHGLVRPLYYPVRPGTTLHDALSLCQKPIVLVNVPLGIITSTVLLNIWDIWDNFFQSQTLAAVECLKRVEAYLSRFESRPLTFKY